MIGIVQLTLKNTYFCCTIQYCTQYEAILYGIWCNTKQYNALLCNIHVASFNIYLLLHSLNFRNVKDEYIEFLAVKWVIHFLLECIYPTMYNDSNILCYGSSISHRAKLLLYDLPL